MLAAPPAWCCTNNGDDGPCPDHASFDPEGLTSTFTCVVAALIGLHYGHIFKCVLNYMLACLCGTSERGLEKRFSVCLFLGTTSHCSHALRMKRRTKS